MKAEEYYENILYFAQLANRLNTGSLSEEDKQKTADELMDASHSARYAINFFSSQAEEIYDWEAFDKRMAKIYEKKQ